MKVRINQKSLIIGILAMLTLAYIVWADPSGPQTITVLNNQRAADDAAITVQAQAGNVTPLQITAKSVTRFWQGFYGNVSGTIVLQDALSFSLYQWQTASPNGEVYAARNSSIAWTSNIECANESTIRAEDAFAGTNTSANGDMDTVNRTFNYTNHPEVFTGFHNFSGCRSESINGTQGINQNIFWNLILQDNSTAIPKPIYTAIIQQDTTGFNGAVHDFQMIVPEYGSSNQTFPQGTATTYYLFVELG